MNLYETFVEAYEPLSNERTVEIEPWEVMNLVDTIGTLHFHGLYPQFQLTALLQGVEVSNISNGQLPILKRAYEHSYGAS